MVVFIEWIYDLLSGIITPIVFSILNLISDVFDMAGSEDLLTTNFDLYLFSDNLIFSMSFYDIMLLVITLLVVFVAVRLIWKILRKVFRRLFFWGKW